jgi:galactose mutarotase-like enzyme
MPAETWTLTDGREVDRHRIGREPGLVADVLTLGATLQRLEVTDASGVRRNVVLGRAHPQEYVASGAYLGATVGRYANRIAGGRLELDGATYELGTNDRGNTLHGGPEGFDQRVWEVVEADADSVTLRLESPDGDQGFPGAVSVTVTYAVDGPALTITHEATTDALTVVNLTNHAYLNLDGEGVGTIDAHELRLEADQYTPVDATGIPTGAHAEVAGTAFDFRAARPLGPAVRRDEEQVRTAQGVDHNVVLRGEGLRVAAELTSPASGLRAVLSTDQPGLQVYTGNFLDGTTAGTSGALYRQGAGIAMEPQRFPDSPHHPEWPSARLAPGETYRAVQRWEISAL